MVNQILNRGSENVNDSPGTFDGKEVYAWLNDPVFASIRNAFQLGWYITELKSRIQIAASDIDLDSITFNQQNNSFVANITSSLPDANDVEILPDVIDALLKNVILNDIEALVSQYGDAGSKALTRERRSLATEMGDNAWLTRMRENFKRIVTLHFQRFPDSDTTDTLYDVNPPSPPEAPDYNDTDFPYLYLYPGKFDYATVGVSLMKPPKTGYDTVTQFIENFRLYDVTRRALNCLTLLWTSPGETLDPVTIECFKKTLVPRILGISPLTTAFDDESNTDYQPVLVEPACEDLPTPSDSEVKEAIKVLSGLVIRLLEAWDGFLSESFYVDIGTTDNEIEQIAYEAGRSLAALTWGISVALVPLEISFRLTPEQQQNPDIQAKLTKKMRNTWVNVFNEHDMKYLQIRISALSKNLDRMHVSAGYPGANGNFISIGQAMQAVNASLSYWQRAVMQMCLPASSFTATPDLISDDEPLLPMHWGNQAKAIRLALIRQVDIWRSLILGQRILQSFNTKTVTQNLFDDFMQEYEQSSLGSINFSARSVRTNRLITMLAFGLLFVILLIVLLAPQFGFKGQPLLPIVISTGTLIIGFVSAFSDSLNKVLGNLFNEQSSKQEVKASIEYNPFRRVFSLTNAELEATFEKGYQQIQLDYNSLNESISITYPLIDFFKTERMKFLIKKEMGMPQEMQINDGYDFLMYIYWNDEERAKIRREVRSAFGSVGTFISGQSLQQKRN